MAHKGKLFPVVFRRDWNLNVNNNNDGWPNRFLLNFLNLPTGFGSLAGQFTYDCGPGTVRFISEMRWVSDPIDFRIFTFHAEISVFIPQPSYYNRRIRLYEDHVGLILELRNFPDGNKALGFFNSFANGVVFWDPTFFDAIPTSTAINTVPRNKRWIDGPPH